MNLKQSINQRKLKDTISTWENHVYHIRVRDHGDYFWLTVKRKDNSPVRNWSDMQDIKNILVGEENEGFELYPAESRLVDLGNSYHMWVYKDANRRSDFGLKHRLVK